MGTKQKVFLGIIVVVVLVTIYVKNKKSKPNLKPQGLLGDPITEPLKESEGDPITDVIDTESSYSGLKPFSKTIPMQVDRSYNIGQLT